MGNLLPLESPMNQPPLYQVANWDKNFENNRSRLVDQCSFICIPNKQGGAGLANVLGEPEGDAIYGIWILLLELCSRQRKPRAGYLTADGKKDGRRFCAAELARLFRRPVERVQRCLDVVSSPTVAWMDLIDGISESHPIGGTPSLERQPGVTPPSLERQTGALERQQEPSPKERRKELLSLSDSEGAAEEGQGNVTPASLEHQPGVTPASHERQSNVTPASPDSGQVQHAEAKRVFRKLSEDVFGEPLHETQWPNDVEHCLDAALPMRRENLDLIDWFYRLPADHHIFTVTRRRQSLRAVIENLQSESQKVRSARKAIGLNGLHEERQPAADDGGWTGARKQAAFEEFGESITLPPKFEQLPVEFQDRIDERSKKK